MEPKFKIGDVVKTWPREWGDIKAIKTQRNKYRYKISGHWWWYSENQLTLVCRAENREDR